MDRPVLDNLDYEVQTQAMLVNDKAFLYTTHTVEPR